MYYCLAAVHLAVLGSALAAKERLLTTMLFAAAVTTLLASAAPSKRTAATSWRLRLSGPGCKHENLGTIFDNDAWPVHNSTSTFDAYIDHDSLHHALSQLQPDCAVVEREQGRPGRDFLVPDGCESGRVTGVASCTATPAAANPVSREE